MATRIYQGEASASPALPLDLLLSAIPSLPRPLLARLTSRLIDHLDELDGDPDLEEGGDLEGIDEREPELWLGGGDDYSGRCYLGESAHTPHPDLARIKRQLSALKRRRRP